MASNAANVRHHQRAIPSVCGSAWNIKAIGAPAINTMVNATRTMKLSSSASSTAATTSPRTTTNSPSLVWSVPPVAMAEVISWASASAPAPSSTPPARTAAVIVLVASMAALAPVSDSAPAQNPSTIRGPSSRRV